MKYAAGYVLSWACYGLGHLVSLCMNTRYTAWLYPIYNTFMTWSIELQDWSGFMGPWKGPE